MENTEIFLLPGKMKKRINIFRNNLMLEEKASKKVTRRLAQINHFFMPKLE